MTSFLDVLLSHPSDDDKNKNPSKIISIAFPLHDNNSNNKKTKIFVKDMACDDDHHNNNHNESVGLDLDREDRIRGALKRNRETWYDERMKTKTRPKNFLRPHMCFSKTYGGNTRKYLYTCTCRDSYASSRVKIFEARDECSRARKALLE